VVAVYTKHERLPFSCNHQFLPWLLSLFDIRQFSDVMDFEVAPFFFAIFTFVVVHSFVKLASTCVIEDERRVVHFALEESFSFSNSRKVLNPSNYANYSVDFS